MLYVCFFFKQKTAYEMRISDWSSDVCSSDLDFGTIFYMQVVSSVERGPNRFMIPTLGLENLDQATRDQKVAELYPLFEADIKQNILEYGRTIKSLKDEIGRASCRERV